MSEDTNRQILLAARPVGAPVASDFKLVETPMPVAGDGEMVLRTIYLSLDPYIRGRMNDAESYIEPIALGDVMGAGTVSQVISSNNPKFAVGDFVLGQAGWQEYALSNGKGTHKLDPKNAPLSTALGISGMPGLTAYTGLDNIGKPQEGETIVVAAASGPVGSAVGQIGKIKGCRVVGIAGGPEKCKFVEDELGFDACLDHSDKNFASNLAAACPDGVDVYWENVGGHVFEAVLPLLNSFARVPVCGLIAHYNSSELPAGPNMIPRVMSDILTKRLLVQGFIVTDYAKQALEFQENMGKWIRDGDVKYREEFVDGLENAPEAFMGLLVGKNFGKLVVRVSPDPTL